MDRDSLGRYHENFIKKMGCKCHIKKIFILSGFLFLSLICLQQYNQRFYKSQPFELQSCPGCSLNVTTLYFPPHKAVANFSYTIVGYNHSDPQPCDDEACLLNRGHAPVEFTKPINACPEFSRCVTLTIKTKHRLANAARLILSFYQYFPLAPVIVADELYSAHEKADIPEVFAALLDRLPLGTLTYFQTTPGVGHGRKMAVELAKTPYVIISDDDFVISHRTNLNELLQVLETTDVDIAGGAVDDNYPYSGAMRVVKKNAGPKVVLYPNVFYQSISTPETDCFVSSIVKNFFMGRRDKLLQAGSWDESRRYFEHEDFFLSMRKARLKVAYCPGVITDHLNSDLGLAKNSVRQLRMVQLSYWMKHLTKKWGIAGIYYCRKKEDYLTTDFCSKPTNFNK